MIVTANSNARNFESASSLNRRLGLPFSNLSLLERALTHRSYVNEHQDAAEDNERLEFLGDAALDFVAGAWAYRRFPDMPEGNLTKIRSALVCNDQLAKFARTLNLERALRLGRGEFLSGGKSRNGLLSSLFEAVIGALYLDSGLNAVEMFVIPLLEEARTSVLTKIHDPKSQLQEWTQARKLGAPRYRTILTSGPDHAKEFEVETYVNERVAGRGRGTNTHAAQRAAAADALKNLGIG
ncbi:MAG: ribonuclease III [Anaerolineales bacterium]|nr:ribonuclease III [Anaerolineales bacterium]